MNKPGDYLGGIIDRKTLMDRCYCDPVTECWIWRLSFSQGSPRVHVRMPDGKNKVMRGRRAAVYIKGGFDLDLRGMIAAPAAGCTDPRCVNPDHAQWMSRKSWGEAFTASGRGKDQPGRTAANRRIGQARRRFTPEQVREIKASPESTYVMARRLGVSQNTIHAIRVGKSYQDVTVLRAASVFSWRPQA